MLFPMAGVLGAAPSSDSAEACIGRGDAKYAAGDFTGALSEYDRALQLKPSLAVIPHVARSSHPALTNDLARDVVALLAATNYVRLDELAARLRLSKERYADGGWKLSVIYEGLLPADTAADDIWEKREQAIEHWIVARPDSITARLALANFLVAYGWKARGSGGADQVTETGWKLFRSRLGRAVEAWRQSNPLKEKCPYSWRILMRVALGAQMDKPHFNQMFARAIQVEPDCENFYVGRAIYLLPQWYGQDGEWGADLGLSADVVGGEKGDLLYAQVVWNMDQRYDMLFFRDDGLLWSRVDKGFGIIEKQFPDALDARIERAHLAIVAGDSQLANYYNSGIEKEEKGDLAGAIADYTKAAEKHNPDDFRALNNRGNVKFTMHDTKGALADYSQAIKLNPGYALAYYSRARVEQSLGQVDAAQADYGKALELQPGFTSASQALDQLKKSRGK